MKKKILIVSILASLLMLSTPVMSSIQARSTPADARIENDNGCSLCAADVSIDVSAILQGLRELEEDNIISQEEFSKLEYMATELPKSSFGCNLAIMILTFVYMLLNFPPLIDMPGWWSDLNAWWWDNCFFYGDSASVQSSNLVSPISR